MLGSLHLPAQQPEGRDVAGILFPRLCLWPCVLNSEQLHFYLHAQDVLRWVCL